MRWIVELIGVIAMLSLCVLFMFGIALAGAQFMTRFFKVKPKNPPKKIWGLVLPTKQEMFYALIALICVFLFMLIAGVFKN